MKINPWFYCNVNHWLIFQPFVFVWHFQYKKSTHDSKSLIDFSTLRFCMVFSVLWKSTHYSKSLKDFSTFLSRMAFAVLQKSTHQLSSLLSWSCFCWNICPTQNCRRVGCYCYFWTWQQHDGETCCTAWSPQLNSASLIVGDQFRYHICLPQRQGERNIINIARPNLLARSTEWVLRSQVW